MYRLNPHKILEGLAYSAWFNDSRNYVGGAIFWVRLDDGIFGASLHGMLVGGGGGGGGGRMDIWGRWVGDAVLWEDGRGAGDEPRNVGEVGGMGRWIGGGSARESHEINDEVGNAEFVSITNVSKVEVDANENTLTTNLT